MTCEPLGAPKALISLCRVPKGPLGSQNFHIFDKSSSRKRRMFWPSDHFFLNCNHLLPSQGTPCEFQLSTRKIFNLKFHFWNVCVMLATSNTAVKKKRDMVFIAFPDFITFVKNLLCSYSRRHRDLSSFEIQLVSDFLGKTRQIFITLKCIIYISYFMHCKNFCIFILWIAGVQANKKCRATLTVNLLLRYLGVIKNDIRAIWSVDKMISYIMIDYGPFKLIYICVHIDRIFRFEQLLTTEYRWNDRLGQV